MIMQINFCCNDFMNKYNKGIYGVIICEREDPIRKFGIMVMKGYEHYWYITNSCPDCKKDVNEIIESKIISVNPTKIKISS